MADNLGNFIFNKSYWSVVDLQCVSFRGTLK